MEELNQLLKGISNIILQEKTQQEEKRKRGENFNVFKILGLSTSEVRLHSAFLAELLNPNGEHGAGDKFLKIFIEEISHKSDGYNNHDFVFDTLSVKEVKVEKDIGPVEDEHGGRIDICLEDEKGCYVIIENKIYAGDQSKQMKRYWNYAQEMCNKNTNKYRLIYLTLDGHEPSKDSLVDLQSEAYICLSYNHDIIPWLNRCVELSVRQPLIRETIIQYIDILKILTYRDMVNSNELLKVMSKEENLDSVFVIANNLNGMICNIINNTLHPQLLNLAQDKGLKLHFSNSDGWMTDSFPGWDFEHPDWNNFNIRMEFEKRGMVDLIIGFKKKENKWRKDIECWDELLKRTSSIDKNNQSWIYNSFPKPNWNNPDSLREIINGSMIKLISEEIDNLFKCALGLEV